MQRLPFQLSISGLLVAVAGVAVNVWLFRYGPLVGLLGLSLTKHLAIAWLCQVLGVDRGDRGARETPGIDLRIGPAPGGPSARGPMAAPAIFRRHPG